MKKPGFIIFALALVNIAIYLFVTAPPPLEEKRPTSGQVPIEEALKIVNAENAKIRTIYTRDIVGAGLKIGLRFDEDWQEEGVDAGPLPALFLRETSRHLERRPQPLGLFLGSEYPIRAANRFTGKQKEAFAAMERDGKPAFFRSEGTGFHTAMFPDLAVADACVSCHNDHANSPKHDWARGDVMGATTWTYPEGEVPLPEVLALIDALRGSVAEAYASYLEKAKTFQHPPAIGGSWPAQGYALPTVEVFMARVRSETGEQTLDALLATRVLLPDAESLQAGSPN